MIQPADAVVIGGGFAGAAAAYQLSRRGLRNVVLLEQEDLLGRHASGRNAGMARRLVVKANQRTLAIEGIRFMEEPPDDFPQHPYFRRTGALMLGDEATAPELRAAVASAQEAGVAAEWLEPGEVHAMVPATRGGTFAGATYGPEDGVADVAALLDGYLRAGREHGVRVVTGCRLLAIEREADRITAARTSQGKISTPLVVNAAGAWASEVARMAGAATIPLRSLKRHLMVTSPLPWVDRSWPFVWDVTHEVYFRPEPPGLLLSPCDASEAGPGESGTEHAAMESLAEKLTRWLPALAGLTVAHTWAGLRTFTADGNPVLGSDPGLSGFFWCAGLGGNGMTISAAVARLLADAVLGTAPPAEYAASRLAAA
jgi:D-arginine dehydrogenase